MSENCSSCRYWGNEKVDIQSIKWGRCRVGKPETSSRCIDSKRDIWVGSWPWTKEAEWCGEWAQRGPATQVVVGSPEIER
jgi:hypothetical protein